MAGSPTRRLVARLGLALASLTLTFALLELTARLVTPVLLVHERDGIYASTLPLVNGRPTHFVASLDGAPLPRSRTAGELRVAALGESSMEGAPWGHAASPATQLHDALAAALPGRAVTVMNLGRTSSFAMDAFYYLVGAAPYHPDVVWFYLGMNERYDLDREACWPVTHPTLYGAWRWMVERSRLLWLTRVYLPHRVKGLGNADTVRDGARAPGCDEDQAFRAWAGLLVETATHLGARVVVATPVQNDLVEPDRDFADAVGEGSAAEALAASGGAYRQTLTCLLQDGCDLGRVAIERDGWRGLGERTLRRVAPALLSRHVVAPNEQRGLAWREAAEDHGAQVVDFAAALRSLTPGGHLAPPDVVDTVHLSVRGYGLLARLVAERVLAGEPGAGPRIAATPAFPDVTRYERQVSPNTTELAYTYARARQFLVAATLAAVPARAGDPDAQRLRGWLRRCLGMESGLPPDLGAGLDAFEVDRLSRGAR